MDADRLLHAALHGDLGALEVLDDRERERGSHASLILTSDAEACEIGDGSGDGYGDGYGYGSGYGYGDGSGDGYGYGDGYVDGYGDGLQISISQARENGLGRHAPSGGDRHGR